MDTRKSLISKFISIEIVQALAIILGLGFFFINSGLQSFVVTRQEGDTIKGRITAIEAGLDKINDNMKEARKESEQQLKEFRLENKQEMKAMQELILARQSEVTQRMIDRQDKYYEDLRDRIEGSPIRRVPARSAR